MLDVLFLALVAGFVALATLFVAGCSRLIGSSDSAEPGR
jgi:hypothetical protein